MSICWPTPVAIQRLPVVPSLRWEAYALGADSGPESGSIVVRWVFGKADLRSAEGDGSVAALSLVQLIQQVFIPAGGVGRRRLHGGGQNRRVSTELYSRRCLCAGCVGRGLAVTQVLSVSPGPHFCPKHITASPRWGPRPGHKVKGFGAFGSTATTGSWREHKIWIRKSGYLGTVVFQASEATCFLIKRERKNKEKHWEKIKRYIHILKCFG